MLIPITISLAAGLLLLALLAGAALLASRLAADGGPSLSMRGWRWYPSPIGILVLCAAVALIAFRFFPAFLFIPFILPFVLRRGRGGLGNIFRFPGGERDDDDGPSGPRPWR